jgi:hypothetical protein
MLYAMGKNVIVSEETLRDLLEAHASLSAWYYELWAGLRAANATARTPDDAARAAFVERLATEFPELAQVVRSIRVPRMYVPAPPPHVAPGVPRGREEIATIVEPAHARAKSNPGDPPMEKPNSPDAFDALEVPEALAPPPMVDPKQVKYER